MTQRKMKRNVIVDYKSITEDQLRMLNDSFPHGVDEDDLTHYLNSKGETVDAIPLETEDTRYLFKVSVHLDKKMKSFNSDKLDEIVNSENLELNEELDD
ncbi:MAG: hypothetical protein N4A46_07380 [Schleiferiaceae bacterium]|nr:hypothetical protein [Schleiferiaceae bacterium]